MTLQGVLEVLPILNFLVVAVTCAVVIWYTCETRQLRLATLRQTALQIRPFLAIQYGEDGKMWVHNLGNGVARDITFHDARLAEGSGEGTRFLTVEWKPIDFIPQGGTRELQFEGAIITAEERRKLAERVSTWMAHFGPHGHARYEFVAEYSDLMGMKYRAAFNVDKGHTELLRDTDAAHWPRSWM